MTDKLDNILKEWAEHNKPSEQHLNELTGQIRVEAVRNRCTNAGDDFGYEVSFFSKLSYAGLGAAAALLVMLGVQFSSHTNGASAFAHIPCEELKVSQKLFSEMRQMFPEKLRWVSESNGDLNMGLESLSGDIAESSEAMLVRVSIVAREQGDKAWKPVWNTDIILRGEELTEIPASRGDDSKIALWVYTLNDGKIAVDTNMALDVPLRLAVQKNIVVDPGEPVEMMSMIENDVEYKVFQTVRPLNNDA